MLFGKKNLKGGLSSQKLLKGRQRAKVKFRKVGPLLSCIPKNDKLRSAQMDLVLQQQKASKLRRKPRQSKLRWKLKQRKVKTLTIAAKPQSVKMITQSRNPGCQRLISVSSRCQKTSSMPWRRTPKVKGNNETGTRFWMKNSLTSKRFWKRGCIYFSDFCQRAQERGC